MPRIVKKPEDRRREIVETARRLFKTKKYDKTTMQDVVDALDIAKGTVYHYFKSKEELLEAVVESMVDEDVLRRQLLIKKAQGNALEKLRSLIELKSIAADNETLLKHLHRPSNVGMHARLLAVTLMKEAPLYEKVIRQGCKEGLFQTDTPLECAEFIISAIQFLTDEGIYPWTKDDLSRRARSFPALVEALLKAPQGSFQFMLRRM